MSQAIRLQHVRVNNLDIDELTLETGKLHVFHGPSGSGKSSLAFDILYSEADRLGNAYGISQVYRKNSSKYSLQGLPECVIGIEQQINYRGFVESVGYHTGITEQILSQHQSGSIVCPECSGKGYRRDIDPSLVVRDDGKPVTAGALTPAVKQCVGIDAAQWKVMCSRLGISPKLPWKELSAEVQDTLLWNGHGKIKAIVPSLRDSLSKRTDGDLAEELPYYTQYPQCSHCNGWGAVIQGKAPSPNLVLGDVKGLTAAQARWIDLLELAAVPALAPMFQQSSAIFRKLRFYAALQHLQPQSLVIFDEPAAGLTRSEANQMAKILRQLQKQGHTVIAVDHVREIIQAADIATQFGPGSGAEGGKVVSQGPPPREPETIQTPGNGSPIDTNSRQRLSARFSSWYGFTDMDIDIPLQKLICVSGISGSGKTAYLDATFAACDKTPTAWQGRTFIETRSGQDRVRRPHRLTPAPIGIHPGSTPATYTDLWDKVREVFAQLPQAKKRKLKKGHFSFNTKQGQCPKCKGQGYLPVNSSHFVECPVCNGRRHQEKYLSVHYKDNSIADVGALTMRQASRLFAKEKDTTHYLKYFSDVALEYLVLGQPSNTLSGGENLRVKIVKLLSRKLGDRSLYLMDNPCRGIGEQATSRLIEALRRLTRQHTVFVAENDPELATFADWFILLGRPKERSGRTRSLNVLYQGPPAHCPHDLWAQFSHSRA